MVGIEIGIDPCPEWRQALMDPSNLASKHFQLRNNTVESPGPSSPNSTPRPSDTDTDLASLSTFGNSQEHGLYPPPWPALKRHRALYGRLPGFGWESPDGKVATFSDVLQPTPFHLMRTMNLRH